MRLRLFVFGFGLFLVMVWFLLRSAFCY